MAPLSLLNIPTFEHLELDTATHSWVRCVNQRFTQETVVENTYEPGLYISVIGRCQYSPVVVSDDMDNYNYHYTVTFADAVCSSRILFPEQASWQAISIMIPFAQLHDYGITSLDKVATHFRPEARLSELGAVSSDILSCCEHIWSCEFTGIERTLFIKAKAMEVLSLFLHKWREHEHHHLSSRLSQLKHALAHIENHLDQDWPLSSVARLARSNQTYIKQDVKDLHGMSFRKWLNRKRLKTAVELLSSNKPINQIAGDIGYKSQAHFATFFKNEIGLTPSEYRQSLLLNHTA